MINIDHSKLNPLEHQIYDQLLSSSKTLPDIKIVQAAELCGCSVSKISKFAKKLGFPNFKQYIDFLYGKEITVKVESSELQRIKNFIDDFDSSMIDDFIELLDSHEKIILFGYGPSFIVAQYFEYKLRISTNRFIIAVPDEMSIETLIDDKCLLVIFTTTGSFRSFESIYQVAKKCDADVLVIAEEYNASLMTSCDRLFWLSRYAQSSELKPHEKSRTLFFIFIEEIIQRLLSANRKTEEI
jgi:DNA-binding MurR/RpiR family transcriptional regulator